MSTEWWCVARLVRVGNYWWCDEICSGEDELHEEVAQEMGVGCSRVRKDWGKRRGEQDLGKGSRAVR